MKDLTTYKIPPVLAAALSTNRPELIHGFMEARGLTPVEFTEVLRLVADLITDRQLVAEKLEQLQESARMLVQTNEGNIRRLLESLNAVTNARGGG